MGGILFCPVHTTGYSYCGSLGGKCNDDVALDDVKSVLLETNAIPGFAGLRRAGAYRPLQCSQAREQCASAAQAQVRKSNFQSARERFAFEMRLRGSWFAGDRRLADETHS